jgi:hypothetical protein
LPKREQEPVQEELIKLHKYKLAKEAAARK